MFYRILTCLALMATPLGAEPRFLNEAEAARWQAVGRINLAGRGFCTGTLIAPDVILSAAHCFFYSRTGNPIAPQDIDFLAGFRMAEFAAHRKGSKITMPPSYTRSDITNDIARITLDAPIDTVTSVPSGPRPEAGDIVTLISYDHTRSEAPMQQECPVIGSQATLLLLDCLVTFGNSGGPVFNENNEIVAIVSAVKPDTGTITRLIGNFLAPSTDNP